MNLVYSATAYVFFKPCGFDDVSLEVGLSSGWGIRVSFKEESVCDKYGACIIPFYECSFSTIGFRLTFTDFEVELLNHWSCLLRNSTSYVRIFEILPVLV